ncbi:hypothetical protein BCV69DRAFT_197762 [Microstroma glucosiphilum]|uniref:Uncharacterized protein n=1 Tax=Pseudomicrostroma glucosiphilum TaxID=1684307 RepID=A0A316UCI7_9BASI|nr:hypothetical protein BCV69DRAFT_197762 [Pseudomicrostroma glucosiphilum]PWN20735.1 hypothetical protein BCV69DRAFT_197762 [Pseudomicrostroma glucosiphilum]
MKEAAATKETRKKGTDHWEGIKKYDCRQKLDQGTRTLRSSQAHLPSAAGMACFRTFCRNAPLHASGHCPPQTDHEDRWASAADLPRIDHQWMIVDNGSYRQAPRTSDERAGL